MGREASDESSRRSAASNATTAGPSRRAPAVVAAGILLSRLSGLLREKLIGFFLGAGPAVDAFRAALRIPNAMQNLLGEGVLSASFIPVYSRLLEEGREREAGRVAATVASLLTLVAGALVLVGVLLARPITAVIVPGFPEGGDKFELTVTLVRILTPGIGFLVLSAWCLGVRNSHRKFFLSYVAPVLWNSAMIAALVGLGSRVTDDALVVALGWGALVGGALQFGVQLPGVLRLQPGMRPSLDVSRPGVRRVLRAFGPVVAGRGVVQLSAWLDVLIASFLAAGAIAALGFAQTLYVLPISLFGMSVAAAELPELSTMEQADRRSINRRLDAGLARIAFFVAPSVVGFVVLGDDIVGLLFQGGEFDRSATLQVWAVLAAYSLGLLASTSSRLLQSSLYAVGDTRTPAIVAVVRVAVSALLGAILMLQFDQWQVTVTGGLEQIGPVPSFDVPPPAVRDASSNLFRLGAVGLALGAAAGSWLEYGLLWRRVNVHFGRVRLGGDHLRPILVAAGAGTVAALGVRWAVGGLSPWAAGGLSPWVAAPLGLPVVAAVYLAVAAWLDVPEIGDLLATLRHRLRG